MCSSGGGRWKTFCWLSSAQRGKCLRQLSMEKSGRDKESPHVSTTKLTPSFSSLFLFSFGPLTSIEAEPVRFLLHLSEALLLSGGRQDGELLPLSRADVSTVCCLRMLVNLVNLSPIEACLNHGNEIFRRPDLGAFGGSAPHSGLVTDILSLTP